MKIDMDEPLTPEKVIAIGKAWEDNILTTLPPEYVLYSYTPEQRMDGLTRKELEDYVEYKMKVQLALAQLMKDRNRLVKMTPPSRIMSRYTVLERLAGLQREDIESYLQTMSEADSVSVAV